MSQAAANAPQVGPQAPEQVPVTQPLRTGIVAWLRIWRQVLVAELLRAMERRPLD
jgi:hypothetical protein